MTHWLDTISAHALEDETAAVAGLLARTAGIEAQDTAIRARASTLIANQRAQGPGSTVEAFLQSYGLTTKEGIAMMCLAEALLRIPDAATADQLIEETFATGNWKQHLGQSDSAIVNASTWALMLTGSVLDLDQGDSIASWFGGLVKRSGEPVIRQTLRAGMKFLGQQFVMGETVKDAISNASAQEKLGYSMSYDILGEGARTDAQAQAYVAAYLAGIREIAAATKEIDLFARPGISVKLSALHPRYTITQEARVMNELLPRLKEIIRVAMKSRIAVSLDAEEANRLELQLEIYRALIEDPEFASFDGIGFVLQAYQKRAIHVASALRDLAVTTKRRLPVRLVKGAYWDSEVKYAQMMGLPGYPVYTRKAHTDLSYLACARELLSMPQAIYPQFATHNALTVASILEMAAKYGHPAGGFEFQRLHGMGESLHDQLVGNYRSRVYAPVGAHKDLLAYLIRRLLENGANSSFVHLLLDQATPIDDLTISPITLTRETGGMPNPHIPLPGALYGPERINPQGTDLGYRSLRLPFLKELSTRFATPLKAAPADLAQKDVPALIARAHAAFPAWDKTPAANRAAALMRAAELMEERRADLLALLITEAKKSYSDAVSEVREAIDFCRYYAIRAQGLFEPDLLPGPTGERNVLTLHGRGVFLCISPWNFPLAIFMGQVVAALVTGNAVIAKPAEQTPRIAAAAVALLHEAGVPSDVLQLACGLGETVGAALVAAPEIAGVCFTGSTAVAKLIGRTLAAKDGPIVPLIAETGGLNAMIVDSSALLEQAVDDIITSAFGSAGQRCSSLRMLFVQHEVAQELHDLLIGAMNELRLGNTRAITTDIGPVIDAEAQKNLLAYIEATKPVARWHHSIAGQDISNDTFVPPIVLGLDTPELVREEVFGPVLHFFTYKAKELSKTLAKIRGSGYGLTFGYHTRLRGEIEEILAEMPVGNRYVNRSMTGAVVGVQPFGGEGLSGTGPKAGGPHYLLRFVTERTTTINTAAIGGNVELLA
jgi:RHH-type proline utilization regulon transcriptional repressor/proline dehydrogenase/delta 1-pyrroline-5-carboxylate dehydrogenase